MGQPDQQGAAADRDWQRSDLPLELTRERPAGALGRGCALQLAGLGGGAGALALAGLIHSGKLLPGLVWVDEVPFGGRDALTLGLWGLAALLFLLPRARALALAHRYGACTVHADRLEVRRPGRAPRTVALEEIERTIPGRWGVRLALVGQGPVAWWMHPLLVPTRDEAETARFLRLLDRLRWEPAPEPAEAAGEETAGEVTTGEATTGEAERTGEEPPPRPRGHQGRPRLIPPRPGWLLPVALACGSTPLLALWPLLAFEDDLGARAICVALLALVGQTSLLSAAAPRTRALLFEAEVLHAGGHALRWEELTLVACLGDHLALETGASEEEPTGERVLVEIGGRAARVREALLAAGLELSPELPAWAGRAARVRRRVVSTAVWLLANLLALGTVASAV